MGKYETKEITTKKIWEQFVAKRPEANFLQSWNWGEFHKNIEHEVARSGFYKNGKLIGVMLSVVEPARRARYLTIPGGPIIDWNDNNLTKLFLEEVKKIAKERNCVFIRVRPQLTVSNFSEKLFRNLGFIKAPIHLHAELTSQLTLEKSEEELLRNMRKSTRYEIKKAANLRVQITSSKNPADIKKFYNLQMETSKRQKFVPFSYKYLYEQFKIFATDDQVILYSAKLKDKLLAQAFIIFYGQEAVYHYGASCDEGRKYPGAYLLQWEAIREAKRRRMSRYNFWGVSPENQKNHRFYGLSVFKRGFGGMDVHYLYAQDLIIKKPQYLINFLIENLRKKIRSV